MIASDQQEPRSPRPRGGALAGLFLATLVGCSTLATPTAPTGFGPPTPVPLPTVQVLVFAAASLTAVIDDVKRAWAHPRYGLLVSTDSSATLAAQIELGAPADLFLSADVASAQRLVDRGLADGLPVAFASNRLVIVLPAGNPGGLRTPFDLARPGIRIIAAGDGVPVSRYAAQVVEQLARLPDAPSSFAASYAANVRSKEDNARAVMAKIELDEGDAAIVYATDARAAPGVTLIEIPEPASVAAIYAGVVVKAGRSRGDARRILDWLAGPEGGAILAGHGFLPPP